MPNIKLLMGKEENLGLAAHIIGQLLFTIDTGHIYFDTDGTAEGRKLLYKDALDDIDALETLVGTKSVATQIQEAIAKLTNGTGDGEGETPSIQLITEVAAGTGIKVDATNASKPTVSVKLKSGDNNPIKVDENGALYVDEAAITDYTVEIEKLETPNSGMASSYKIKQGATNLDFTIDIPKDLMVQSGSVVTYTDENLPTGVTEAGTYIKLVLNDEDNTPLYVNVGSLIEYVTSGSESTDDVFVVVSSDHKVTATLSAAIKASLAKADTAVQPADLETAVVAKKYISGFTIDNETNKIQVQTATLPDVSGLEWGSFGDLT